jgi:predicted phosphodiesterase
MKAQIISDIHTEWYDNPSPFLMQLRFEENLDFLILAGDIVSAGYQPLAVIKKVFDFLATKARNVIYVVGNHEYYKSSSPQTEFNLRSVMPKNFTWLMEDEATIEGVHFYGGALWFPDSPMNIFYEGSINDFQSIHGLKEWVYTSNKMFTTNAKQLIKPETVVVSHHLPHASSTPERFVLSEINRFFVADQTEVIMEKRPRFWIHGHTHDACRYKIEDTEVICNPCGYPLERRDPATYPVVVVEV